MRLKFLCKRSTCRWRNRNRNRIDTLPYLRAINLSKIEQDYFPGFSLFFLANKYKIIFRCQLYCGRKKGLWCIRFSTGPACSITPCLCLLRNELKGNAFFKDKHDRKVFKLGYVGKKENHYEREIKNYQRV